GAAVPRLRVGRPRGRRLRPAPRRVLLMDGGGPGSEVNLRLHQSPCYSRAEGHAGLPGESSGFLDRALDLGRRWIMTRSAFIPMLALLSFFGGSPGLAETPLPPIVFVSRQLGDPPTGPTRQLTVDRARRGSLLVIESNGELRTLVDAAAAPGM